ncbi:MAG: LLM class flavin-dependent oxidoreductase [Actinomycetia bacterium]|nr:LLM class flavin-dependent oxidoreductase [Actinomycetes bacterium]
MHAGLRFGIFMAPQHKPEGNPTLALQRDLALIQHIDALGFDEAWIGEHHSAGSEIIASPEVFIAAAAERTQRIRLGTGVVSVPYHHPYMIAERLTLLDHLTRGRVMLGVGPGALPTDAWMLGIDPVLQRERLQEGLDAILALLRSEEPVTINSEWFTMREAALHLRPYTDPHFEVAVAAVASPTGWSLAGRYGIGLLGVAATTEAGFETLATNWEITEAQAREHSTSVDRRDLRLVGIVHIAETKAQAIKDVRFGLDHYVDYFQQTAAFPQLGFAGSTFEERVEYVNESGFGTVGTVEDAVEQIRRLEEASGGFGCFLLVAHEWANLEATNRSYELFARYVMPQFQGSNRETLASEARARELRQPLFDRHQQALDEASARHARH